MRLVEHKKIFYIRIQHNKIFIIKDGFIKAPRSLSLKAVKNIERTFYFIYFMSFTFSL